MAEFYSARGWEIPPLPWTNLSPPFSDVLLNFLPKGVLAFPGSGITNNLIDIFKNLNLV